MTEGKSGVPACLFRERARLSCTPERLIPAIRIVVAVVAGHKQQLRASESPPAGIQISATNGGPAQGKLLR